MSFFSIVRWVLVAQLLVATLTGFLVWIFSGSAGGKFAFAGGLIAFLPNLVFSLGFGLRDDRRTARRVARSFYISEVLKLVLTVVLFAVIFQVSEVQVFPLFLGFVLTLNVFWFALLMRVKG